MGMIRGLLQNPPGTGDCTEGLQAPESMHKVEKLRFPHGDASGHHPICMSRPLPLPRDPAPPGPPTLRGSDPVEAQGGAGGEPPPPPGDRVGRAVPVTGGGWRGRSRKRNLNSANFC